MDDVADRIIDTVLNYHKRSPPAVVNIIHFNPIPWTFIQSHVSDALYETGVTPEKLPLVPYNEWFSKLDDAAQSSPGLHNLVRTTVPFIRFDVIYGSFIQPAAKMLGFYRQLDLQSTILSLGQGLRTGSFSTSFELDDQIGQSDAQKWVRFWKEQKLL